MAFYTLLIYAYLLGVVFKIPADHPYHYKYRDSPSPWVYMAAFIMYSMWRREGLGVMGVVLISMFLPLSLNMLSL
jgi:hypothetical protein